MDNLSAAQFNMVRRGSDAAVAQTRPILGTIKKVADAVGYKLGRQQTETTTRDINGNQVSRQVTDSRGFTDRHTHFDKNDNETRRSMTTRGLPGFLGGRRDVTTVEVPGRNTTTRMGPGTTPPFSPWPPGGAGPTGGGGPAGGVGGGPSPIRFSPTAGASYQPGRAGQFDPALGRVRSLFDPATQQTAQSGQRTLNNALQAVANQRSQQRFNRRQARQGGVAPNLGGNVQPQDISAFNQPSPLPFNGSPQGRSDYGNPFGTP